MCDTNALSRATHCYVDPTHNRSTVIDFIHPDTGLTFIYGRTESEVVAHYPAAVRMLYADWKGAQVAIQDRPVVWLPSTAESYDSMLNVLPPIDWSAKGFLVGEPEDHSLATGQPRYRAYRKAGDIYTVSSRPLTRVEWRAV